MGSTSVDPVEIRPQAGILCPHELYDMVDVVSHVSLPFIHPGASFLIFRAQRLSIPA